MLLLHRIGILVFTHVMIIILRSLIVPIIGCHQKKYYIHNNVAIYNGHTNSFIFYILQEFRLTKMKMIYNKRMEAQVIPILLELKHLLHWNRMEAQVILILP